MRFEIITENDTITVVGYDYDYILNPETEEMEKVGEEHRVVVQPFNSVTSKPFKTTFEAKAYIKENYNVEVD